jgi:hypothetical protein
MAWHYALRLEIAVMFQRLSCFRAWWERGDNGIREGGKVLRTSYERCTITESKKLCKQERDRFYYWKNAAGPVRPRSAGPKDPVKAAYYRKRYLDRKQADPAKYCRVLVAQRKRNEKTRLRRKH